MTYAHVDVGCGLWNPEADALAALREDIDENADQWKEVLRAPEMRSELLGGVRDEDDAVVKAFAHHNRESALKTKPKVCGTRLVFCLFCYPRPCPLSFPLIPDSAFCLIGRSLDGCQ